MVGKHYHWNCESPLFLLVTLNITNNTGVVKLSEKNTILGLLYFFLVCHLENTSEPWM